MKHQSVASLIALICLLFTLGTKASDATIPGAISVGIETLHSNVFLLGEPVELNLVIKNNSSNTVSVLTPSFDRFGYRTLKFGIRAPTNDAFVNLVSPNVYLGAAYGMAPPKGFPVTSVLPLQKVTFSFTFDYEFPNVQRRRWLFPIAGAYDVKAEVLLLMQPALGEALVSIDSPRIPVESAPLGLIVAEPEHEIDRQAFGALRKSKHEFLIYAPEQFSSEAFPEAISEIEEFARTNEKSRYFAMAKLLLLHADASKAVASRNGVALQMVLEETQALLSDDKLRPTFRAKAQKLVSTAQSEIQKIQN